MLLETLKSALQGFPWPLLPMRALWRKYDTLKPWKFFRVRAAMRACRDARGRPRTERQVVFVSDAPRMREAKIARGLRAAGWEVILLYRQATGIDLPFYFTRTEQYGDRWDALERASRYSPQAYHAFVCLGYDTAAAFVRHRPGPVIVDSSDLLKGMKSPWYLRKYFPGQVSQERYCLENADGICCRDLQVQYIRKTFGYRKSARTIFFPDLSLAEAPGPTRRPAPDSEIHVVLIGIIAIEQFLRYWPDSHFLKVAETLTRNGVHFHLYASSPLHRGKFELTFSGYLKLARRNPFFHFHKPVPLPRLLEEMSGYTFGLHIAGSMLHFRPTPFSGHLRPCYDWSVTNRQFDYLQAGLPIILHDGRLPTWVISRLGVAIPPDPGFLTSPARWLRQRLPDAAQRRKLDRARGRINIMLQIPRLERFYRSIPNLPGC